MQREKKLTRRLKTIFSNALIIIMILVLMGSSTIVYADESKSSELPELSKPKFRPTGTYYVKYEKDFYEILTSDVNDSKILYSREKDKNPETDGELYTKPIPITGEGGVSIIKAINTKDGFSNSDVVSRKYTRYCAAPPSPWNGIKTNIKLKKGMKKIRGTIKFKPEVKVYIKLTVKKPNGKKTTYHKKVNKGKWTIKLKKKLKKGDKVIISLYTKHYIVRCIESKTDKTKMNLMIEYPYGYGCLPIKKKIK